MRRTSCFRDGSVMCLPPCTAALFVRKSRAAAFRRCGNQPSVCAQCSNAAPKQAAAADAHTNCAACLSWLAFDTKAPAHRMASAVTGSPFVYGAAPAWAWRRLNASCRRAGPGVTATASANASIARPGATILPHSWWAGLPGKKAPTEMVPFWRARFICAKRKTPRRIQ